jgi:DnaJ-class molecular chaperone
MASAKDHYAILGIARNADPEVVRAAYRALAKKYHPDTANHTNLVGRFQEINEAYLVLSDAERRAQYDHATFEKPSEKPPEKPSKKTSRESASTKATASNHTDPRCLGENPQRLPHCFSDGRGSSAVRLSFGKEVNPPIAARRSLELLGASACVKQSDALIHDAAI